MSPCVGIIAERKGCATGGLELDAEGGPEFDADHHDHVIVWNERHLERLLVSFLDYFHNYRAHQSLADNSPDPRVIEPPEKGDVVSVPMVGGLHHCYRRAG